MKNRNFQLIASFLFLPHPCNGRWFVDIQRVFDVFALDSFPNDISPTDFSFTRFRNGATSRRTFGLYPQLEWNKTPFLMSNSALRHCLTSSCRGALKAVPVNQIGSRH